MGSGHGLDFVRDRQQLGTWLERGSLFAQTQRRQLRSTRTTSLFVLSFEQGSHSSSLAPILAFGELLSPSLPGRKPNLTCGEARAIRLWPSMELSNITLPAGSRISPNFSGYRSTGNYTARVLKPLLITSFQNDGYILLKKWLSQDQTYSLQDMVEQIREWPIAPDSDFMPYHEINSRGETVLSRTENFADYHPGLEVLLSGETLRLPLEDLVEGRQMRLFKEKINYKFAGSGG